MFAAARPDGWLGMAGGRWFDRPRGIAQLWGMWVAPEVRSTGTGAELLLAVEAWARDRGAGVLRLGVIDEVGIETYYARLGFARSGESHPLTRDTRMTARFMVRAIGPAPGGAG